MCYALFLLIISVLLYYISELPSSIPVHI